jgi:hypothetical protein
MPDAADSLVPRYDRAPFYMRFEDPALQSVFLAELTRRGIPYVLNESGSVGYGPDTWFHVMDAANVVRDAQFPWFFLLSGTETDAARLRACLQEGGFRFFVEHSNTGSAFGVRREDADALRKLTCG